LLVSASDLIIIEYLSHPCEDAEADAEAQVGGDADMDVDVDSGRLNGCNHCSRQERCANHDHDDCPAFHNCPWLAALAVVVFVVAGSLLVS